MTGQNYGIGDGSPEPHPSEAWATFALTCQQDADRAIDIADFNGAHRSYAAAAAHYLRVSEFHPSDSEARDGALAQASLCHRLAAEAIDQMARQAGHFRKQDYTDTAIGSKAWSQGFAIGYRNRRIDEAI